MTSERPAPSVDLRERFESAGGKHIYVRKMFGSIAHVYDLMNRIMTAGMDGRWREFAVRQIALGPREQGLDIGTGTGDLAIALAQCSAPAAHVIGIDFTPEMLEIGRKKLERLSLRNRVELIQGDGEHLAFDDGSFDACCSAFVVRNLADIRQGFAEMYRVVKPGGKVVCLEMSHPPNPVFSAGYHLYFDRLVPLLGKMIGRAFEAYSYLPSSVSSFPDAPSLKRAMEEAGWRDVRYHYRMFGVVAIHVGTRP